MRVLIAPQEFKGSLTAVEAAHAIAAGIVRVHPGWVLDLLPLSDGGPGFLDVFEAAGPVTRLSCSVQDALGRPAEAEYLLLADGVTAVVEAAQANGLVQIAMSDRDPLRAGSFGVGQLLAAAAGHRPPRIIVGVGGSASTDGGAGMARALGARFLDASGQPLAPGGAALAALDRIVPFSGREFAGIEVVAAVDVQNPLVGPAGAAAVYAPQKGASPAQVATLEAALRRYAAVVLRDLGSDLAQLPAAGAAGGLAGGLVAFLEAHLQSGFDTVALATGLRARVQAAGLVVTGEGSFDAQSLSGKGTGRLLALAASLGKPTLLLAGRSDRAGPGIATLAAIEPDVTRSMSDAAQLLALLTQRASAALAAHGGGQL